MNNRTGNKVNSTRNEIQTLMLTEQSKPNGFSIHLADGESWDNRSTELAIMVANETYLEKIHVPQKNNEDSGLRMNHVTIRRNAFTPEYEPSRHDMRIFDALDGIVTEM